MNFHRIKLLSNKVDHDFAFEKYPIINKKLFLLEHVQSTFFGGDSNSKCIDLVLLQQGAKSRSLKCMKGRYTKKVRKEKCRTLPSPGADAFILW